MNKYEVIFILRLLEEEATNEAIAKFENLIKAQGGEFEKIDRWGKKRLAYPVKDVMDGYYCLFFFAAEPKAIAELDRVMKITDEVLKYMILKEDK